MVFIDTEVNPKTRQIQDIGCIKSNRDEFHSNDLGQLIKFIKREDYFVGHNIIKHDLVYLHKTKVKKYIDEHKCIDTLFLSTLLYPEKPYHSLVKDDKLYTDSVNNPLNDSKTTQKLFADIVDAFNKLDGAMKDIFFTLLSEIPGFEAFFNYLKYKPNNKKIQDLIKKIFKDKYCENAELGSFINKNQVELAYSLALINTNEVESLLPGWVLKSYPEVENILWKLRNTPCHENCHYCDNHLSPLKALNQYFSYLSFRDFDGVPLQEQACQGCY
jgi:ATP-dependent DNA helicase RecQ